MKTTKDQTVIAIAEVRDELDNFNYVARVNEVINHQAAASEAAGVVVSLERLITEQQLIIEANSGLPVGELYKESQELLSDSALGKNVTKEIEQLAGKIETKENELVTAEKNRTDAEHAIVGLRRKLAEAKQQTKFLEGANAQKLLHFLKDEAEFVAVDYAKKAGELWRLHQRLLGLNAMIMNYSPDGGRISIMTSQAHKLQIPAFKVVAHNVQQDSTHGMLFSTKTATGNLPLLIESEKSRIKEFGIKI